MTKFKPAYCKVDSQGRDIPSVKLERAYYENLSYAGQTDYNIKASEGRYPTKAEYKKSVRSMKSISKSIRKGVDIID